jgi:signal transduction histidine kinase/CheY-like chemotaxis protein
MTDRVLAIVVAEALAAAGRHVEQLSAAAAEAQELRRELDETNRGLLAVYAELSDRQQELELARHDAEQASNAKSHFLATMSHEIRSPLTAVLGFTSLLLDTDLSDEQREYATAARTAGNHLQRVIDDVLDMARIEAGRLDLEHVEFDLVACVEEAVSLVAPAAEDKQLALAALFTPATPIAVVGDPVRLRQVLVNLLANAVKFTSAGQVTVEVTTEPGERADQVALAFHVRDTGIGIAPDAVERLFLPFTQADASTTRRFGGTGLGLSISRHLAEQMGGTITVESQPGVGSTFTATVVVDVLSPAVLATEHDRPLDAADVLLVHDQPAVAEAIARCLTMWGANVVPVESVPEAQLRAGDWAGARLVVLGAAVPATVLSGARQLAAGTAHAPLAIAVVPLAARRALGELTGQVHAVITTPVHRTQLYNAVVTALGAPSVLATRPAAAPAQTTAALRILVADDDPAIRRSTVLLLRRLGHQVDAVADGEQAVAAVLAGDYDVVLMDLHMPRLDGIEATRRIRQQSLRAPAVVALTAAATEDNRLACERVGMTGFLAKPVDVAQLTRVVGEARGVAQTAQVSP